MELTKLGSEALAEIQLRPVERGEEARCQAQMADHHHPGALPKIGETTEIGMAIPLLDRCDVAGKDIAADALLAQRAVATYIVEQQAHCHFTAKGNQPALERDIALLFAHRRTMSRSRPPITVASKLDAFGAARHPIAPASVPKISPAFDASPPEFSNRSGNPNKPSPR